VLAHTGDDARERGPGGVRDVWDHVGADAVARMEGGDEAAGGEDETGAVGAGDDVGADGEAWGALGKELVSGR
jgi:hypothetical protein